MRALVEQGQKPREPRIAVVIPSRMRLGTEWTDVCIRNISSRGMLVQARARPAVGSYVDIRRGTQTIIGRVVWRKDALFGVRTQDRIDIQAIVNEPRLARRPNKAATGEVDRRAAVRASMAHVADRAERSRRLSSMMQFAFLAAAACGASAFVAAQAHEIIARPLATVTRALG